MQRGPSRRYTTMIMMRTVLVMRLTRECIMSVSSVLGGAGEGGQSGPGRTPPARCARCGGRFPPPGIHLLRHLLP